MKKKANVALVIVQVVVGLSALGVAVQVVRRVASDVALTTEHLEQEAATAARWRGYVEQAVTVDPSQPLTVPAGTLVVAHGTLAGEGALRDDELGIERPGALTLARKLWAAEAESQQTTTREWDPVARPTDPGWRSSRGATRTKVTTSFGVRWTPAYVGTPRAADSAVPPRDETRAANPKLGVVPLAPALVAQIPEASVPLTEAVLAKRTDASLVDESTLQLGSGRAGSFRVVLVERAAEAVTVFARFDGAALTTWQPEGTDDFIGSVRPGQVDAKAFLPKPSDVVAAGPTSVVSALLGDPARMALVLGAGLVGLALLVAAAIWRP